MLSFTDDELQILMWAAVPIRTDHRDRFLRDLSNELMSRPDCPIAQAVNDLQRRWLDRSNPCSCTRPPMWRMSDKSAIAFVILVLALVVWLMP